MKKFKSCQNWWLRYTDVDYTYMYGFVGGTKGKKTHLPVQKTQETESILRLGRSPRGGHGNPLQYSYLENSMDRGAWSAIVHHKESDTIE